VTIFALSLLVASVLTLIATHPFTAAVRSGILSFPRVSLGRNVENRGPCLHNVPSRRVIALGTRKRLGPVSPRSPSQQSA